MLPSFSADCMKIKGVQHEQGAQGRLAQASDLTGIPNHNGTQSFEPLRRGGRRGLPSSDFDLVGVGSRSAPLQREQGSGIRPKARATTFGEFTFTAEITDSSQVSKSFAKLSRKAVTAPGEQCDEECLRSSIPARSRLGPRPSRD